MPEIKPKSCTINNLKITSNLIDGKIYLKKETDGIQKSTNVCIGPGHFNFKTENIISLDLSNCSLTDLPTCLTVLKLKELNLSNNSLKIVPECLVNGLKHIEILNLENNSIKDFDIEPMCAFHLRELNLNRNRMLYLPIWILKVKSLNLETLYYNDNVIHDTKDSLFNKVASYRLKKLVLRNSNVSSHNLTFLKAVRTLKYLDLSNNNNNCSWNRIFDKPSWFDTLEVLKLNHMCLDLLPKELFQLKNLKELYLQSNELFWVSSEMDKLIHLEILDLSRNVLTEITEGFGKLSKLKVLYLSHNQLHDVRELSTLRNLETLDLYDNQLERFNLDLVFTHIDLEQNYFDTSILNEEYEKKKDSYRRENLLDRIDGRREMVSESDASESNGCNGNRCSESDFEDDFNCDLEEDGDVGETFALELCKHVTNEEEEDWDRKCNSNPEITPSDDEWDGNFITTAKKKIPKEINAKKINYFAFYEDVA